VGSAGGAEPEHRPVVRGLETSEHVEGVRAFVERPEAQLHLGLDRAGDAHHHVPGILRGGLVDDAGQGREQRVVGAAMAAPAGGGDGHAEHLSTTGGR